MTELSVAVFNYENGGRRAPGRYDVTRLQTAFAEADPAPAVIGILEAKEWQFWGNSGLLAAAQALSTTLHRPYAAHLGHSNRSPSGPALFYDPQVICLNYWGDNHETVHDDKRNLARAHLRSHPDSDFRVLLQHWPFHSGDARLAQAHLISGYADGPPTLLTGDLNTTASGPHLPQRNWLAAHPRHRRHKGTQLCDNTWTADTRALDLLIGTWNPDTHSRDNSAGWHALAELAASTGTPPDLAYQPTVNDQIDHGGGLLIDWLLVNDTWHDGLIPDTYRVHIPPGTSRDNYPSDHRLVTATLRL